MIKSHLSTAWDGLHSREVKPSVPHFLQENIKRLQSDRTHSTTDQNTRGITVLHMLMIIMYYISNPLLQVINDQACLPSPTWALETWPSAGLHGYELLHESCRNTHGKMKLFPENNFVVGHKTLNEHHQHLYSKHIFL